MSDEEIERGGPKEMQDTAKRQRFLLFFLQSSEVSYGSCVRRKKRLHLVFFSVRHGHEPEPRDEQLASHPSLFSVAAIFSPAFAAIIYMP